MTHQPLIRLLAAAIFTALAAVAVRGQTPSADRFEKFTGLVYAERSGDGGKQRLLCDVYVPLGDGPFPAVLCVHGGAWRLGRKEHMTHVAEKLAPRGYVAVAINYRLAPTYKFPAQQEDCHDALTWMKNNAAKYKIDPRRIAAIGYSAGAQMVTLKALRDVQARTQADAGDSGEEDAVRLQAVVAGGTPCDFRSLPADSKALAYWLDGTRREFPKRYAAASPAAFVSGDAPPMLFFHGERDAMVPRAGVESMVGQLQQAGAVARLYLVPESGHISAFFNEEAYDRAIDFLDEHLKVTGS